MSDDRVPPDVPVRVRFGNASDEVPTLPFQLLVVADLTAEDAISAARAVTKETFAELIEKLAPRLRYEVRNCVNPAPARLALDLSFRTPRAFEPAAVVAQVPLLQELVELRRTVLDVIQGRAGIEQLQALPPSPLFDRLRGYWQVRAAPPAPAPPSARSGADVDLGRLLDMVDIPGAPARGEPLDRAIQEIVRAVGSGPSGRQLEGHHAQAGLAEIDGILSAQLDAIIHSAEYARVESSWRGLRFLVERADFRAGVRVEVVSAPLARVAEVIETMARDGATPSLIIADYALGPSVAHAELAEALARAGEELRAPVVAGIDPAFFGVRSWSECAGLPALPQLFEREEYTLWRALRGKDCAYWLSLAVGRFFVRPPFDLAASAAFPYHESPECGGVWANSVWAVGAAALRSAARGGYGLDLTGAAGSGLIADLPLCEAGSSPSPWEPTFAPERAQECGEVGLINFAVHGGDGIVPLAMPVYRRTPRYADGAASLAAAQQATLAHSMVAGRVAAFLERVRDQLLNLGPAETCQRLEKLLTTLLGSASAASVQMRDDREHPSRQLLQVSVRPSGMILGRPVEINLAFTLPR